MISEATHFEVMLSKMFRAAPGSKRLKIVSRGNRNGDTVLHMSAHSGLVESSKVILAQYQNETQRQCDE